MNFSYKTHHIHLFFIFILASHYVLPLFFFGQVVIDPHDNLDIVAVYDHIVSKIYKGNSESLNYFLSGEIKWYYIDNIFYPINVLHYFLSDKLFYFTDEILRILLAYYFFYIFSKSLEVSKFNSGLGAVLYSTFIHILAPSGLGLSLLPYILYLILNKNTLKKKHYFFLFLIGLNSSLPQDIFVFILLIPLAFILDNKRRNIIIYLQVFSVILISLTLSSIHLFIGTFFEETNRAVFLLKEENLFLTIIKKLKSLFYLDLKTSLFIFAIPITILQSILLILSIFSNKKNIKLIFFFTIFIFIITVISSSQFIDIFFIGILEIFKGFNFARLNRILIIIYPLLFVLLITNLQNNNLKKFLYFFCFLSIISIQLKTPLLEIGRSYLKENMRTVKFQEIKKNLWQNNYIQSFKILLNSNSYNEKKIKVNYYSNKTFDNYYKFKDYAFIKNIVNDSRVMSVGLDPMIAVMNDIRVIDGYHQIYPLRYKIEFRKIIANELEANIELKKYYDNWGSRVYAFYNEKNNLMLNFQSAKILGADYVISKFPIKNTDLKIICYECNNSSEIFLYKIL